MSIKVRFPAPETINKAQLREIDSSVLEQNYGAALELLESVLPQIAQPPWEIIYDKAWLLDKVGRNQEAIDTLNGLLTKHQDNVHANYLKAIILQKHNNYNLLLLQL